MAWDDEPPPKEAWDAAPPTETEMSGRSVMGAVKNLGTDIVDTAKGVYSAGKQLVPFVAQLPVNQVKSVGEIATGTPLLETSSAKDLQTMGKTALNMGKGLVEEGKRIGLGELLTGNPGEAVDKFGAALYDKPLTTALDVAPVVGAAGKALGFGKTLKTAEMAAEAGNLADDAARAGTMADDVARMGPTGAPAPLNLGDEAAQILKEPPKPPTGAPQAAAGATEQAVPMGGTFRETVANLEKQIPQQVKEPMRQVQEFLSQKYGQAAAKPGFADTLGDAMIRRAQGMRFRELGGTPGQARVLTQRIGEEGVRELMDIAKERGITRSPIGATRRAATKQLQESSGKAIGGIRELASKRGAVHNAKALVDEIRAQLDAEYLGKGMASGEKGAYTKALEDIKTAATSPEKLAQKITEMNRRAVKNKMTQPTGAVTDVANAASRINNQLIKKHLSPKEVAFYEKNLADFGASKIFEKLQSFEVGREMGGRAGVGGLWRNIKQGAMDMGGSKVMENFYDRFGPRLKSTPGIAKNLGSLTEGAIDDLLGALDNAIDEVVVK